MILPMITAIVASMMGTRLAFTVVKMPMLVSIFPRIKLAPAAFSATLRVIKNKIMGNRSNKNFINCFQ